MKKVLTVFLILILNASLSSMAQSACPDDLEAYLKIGGLAQVTPGDANNVRKSATTSSESVGKIPGGEVFEVMDGPLCADGYVWWQVQYLDIRGWTVEGDGDVYWIVPYEQPDPLPVAVISDDETSYTVNYAGIHFAFDATLADGVDYEPIAAWDGMGGGQPSHHEFTFTHFADNGEERPSPIPRIAVYPFDRLVEQVVNGKDKCTALLTLLDEKPQTIDDDIPIMIGFGAAQILRAQIKYIDFEGGRGLRFLTFYAQDLLFADNESIRYMFVGLTDDNSSFILGDFPVDASILPDKVDYRDYDSKTHEANYPTYLAETTTALTNLPASEFTPDLSLLDAMFASLVIEGTD